MDLGPPQTSLKNVSIRGAVFAVLLVCCPVQAAQLWTGYSPSQKIDLSITRGAENPVSATSPAPRGMRIYVLVDELSADAVQVTAQATHIMRDAEEVSVSPSSFAGYAQGDQKLIAGLSNLVLGWSVVGNRVDVVRELDKAVEQAGSCSSVAVNAQVALGWAQLGIDELDGARRSGQRLRDRCGSVASSAGLHGRWLIAENDMRQGRFRIAQAGYSDLLSLINEGDLAPEWRWHRLELEGKQGIACIQHSYTRPAQKGIGKCMDVLNNALEQADAAGDYKLSAEFLNLMAPYHWSRRDYRAAGKVLKLSRLLFELAGTTDGLAGTLNNLALNEGWLGNIGEAQNLYRDALGLVDAPDLRASVLRNLARNYQVLGELQLAERYYRRALNAFASGGSSRAVALAQSSLGSVVRMRGRPAQALELHLKAHQFFADEPSVQHASTLFELASDQLALGRLDDARASAENALRVGHESGSAVMRYQAALLAAEVELEDGNPALAQLRLTVAEAHPLPDPPLEARLQRVELGLRLAEAATDPALYALEGERLLGLIAAVRDDLAGGPVQLHWINRAGELIDLYLSGIMRANSQPDAEALFEIIEKNQSIALRARRQSLAAQVSEPSGERKNAGINLQRLVAAESRLASASDEDRASARLIVDEARESYLAARAAAPSAASAAELTFVSLPQVKEQLESDQALILFHFGSRTSFAIAVTRSDVRVESLGPSSELKESIDHFRLVVQRDDLRLAPAIPALSSLFSHLLADPKITRWIAVTDGVISHLPLSGVHVDGPGYRPLGSIVSVVYSPSASAYFESDPPVTYAGDIAIFADPAFHEIDLAGASNQTDFRSWSAGLGRLPHSAVEAAKIVERFPGLSITIATGERATASRLIDDLYTNSRIVHIATHGYYDPATPDIVGLATAPDGSNSDPGFLSLSKIATLQYRARLIVISGCETALGESIRGEGVNGLARALLAQGADSVIGTVWPISDSATAAFMAEFYASLGANGGDAAKALESAQASFRASSRYRAPRYWAGFVLLVAGQSYQTVFGD